MSEDDGRGQLSTAWGVAAAVLATFAGFFYVGHGWAFPALRVIFTVAAFGALYMTFAVLMEWPPATRLSGGRKRGLPLRRRRQAVRPETGPDSPGASDRWRVTTDGFEAGELTVLGSFGFSHPLAASQPASGGKRASVRVTALISCSPLSRDKPDTSELHARFAAFLSSQPIMDLVMSLTSAQGYTWKRYGGNGRVFLEAVLAGEDIEAAPAATAIVEPPRTGFGRPSRAARFVLYIEPRTRAGDRAHAIGLLGWGKRLAQALAVPAALAGFLQRDLLLDTVGDPPARVGIWLTAVESLTELIDYGNLRPAPGTPPSVQFIGYAIHDVGGQMPPAAAEILVAKLCDQAGLDGYEQELARLAKTGADDLHTLVHDLVTDVDMLTDDQGQVEALARSIADTHDDAALVSILPALGSALGDGMDSLIGKRLFWFGRQLLRHAGDWLPDWDLEGIVKADPRGMALLLTDPVVWVRCPDAVRCRCLTALLGPPDNPHEPDPVAVRLLTQVLVTGPLSPDEAARMHASFDLASLDQLYQGGATLAVLAPRIVRELGSGDFGRQNLAARFLYKLPPGIRTQALAPELDFCLGARLVEAAVGNSFGANEALAWRYVSEWPPQRLAGGIWAAVTCNDGHWLRIPASEHLSRLIAAAHGTNLLKEILEFVRNMLDTSLERVPRSRDEAGQDMLTLAGEYTGSDQQILASFGDWLRARIVGE
ncbi:MAG: hypothetical protein ACRDNF_06600 [Streptosporangiaceae bacterium]